MGEVCPCCSGLLYKECCKRYHEGIKSPSPLALMRSRYAAYAKGLPDYIQKTTHPKSPYFELDQKKWRGEIDQFIHTTKFIGLDILGQGDTWVYFAARLEQRGKPITLLEKSHFEQIDAEWLYLSGEITAAR